MIRFDRFLGKSILFLAALQQPHASAQSMIDETQVFPDRLAVYYSSGSAAVSNLVGMGLMVDRTFDGCAQFGPYVCEPSERRPVVIVRVPVGFASELRENIRGVSGVLDVQRVSVADILAASNILIERVPPPVGLDPRAVNRLLERYASVNGHYHYDYLVYKGGGPRGASRGESRRQRIERLLASIDISKTIELNSNPYALKFNVIPTPASPKLDLTQVIMEFLKIRLASSAELSIRKIADNVLIVEFLITSKNNTDLEKKLSKSASAGIQVAVRMFHYAVGENVKLFLVVDGNIKIIKRRAIVGGDAIFGTTRIEDKPEVLSIIKAHFEELSDEVEEHLKGKGVDVIDRQLKDRKSR